MRAPHLLSSRRGIRKKKYWSHSCILFHGHHVIGIYSSNLTESGVFVNFFVLLCGIEQLIVKLLKMDSTTPPCIIKGKVYGLLFLKYFNVSYSWFTSIVDLQYCVSLGLLTIELKSVNSKKESFVVPPEPHNKASYGRQGVKESFPKDMTYGLKACRQYILAWRSIACIGSVKTSIRSGCLTLKRNVAKLKLCHMRNQRQQARRYQLRRKAVYQFCVASEEEFASFLN